MPEKLRVLQGAAKNSGWLLCESKACPFSHSCANHMTAGDFRSEDGLTPKVEQDAEGNWICHTRDAVVDFESVFRIMPVGEHDRGGLSIKNGKLKIYMDDYE